MSKGISLHIGLNTVDPNHYDGWSGPLTACEADADDMEALARSKLFTTQRLLTKAATRGAVRDALGQLAKELVDGDKLFLTYSGHGGAVPDDNGDEPDGQDETWCLYDGQILDDELYQLFAGFARGVRILVLSDSCHSGSVTKDVMLAALRAAPALEAIASGGVPTTGYRAMPRELIPRVYRKHREFYDSLQVSITSEVEKQVKASVMLISGCQDNQLSADGLFNGLFTGTLLRVWKKGTFSGDYKKFHRAIVDRMPPLQTPNLYWIGSVNPQFLHGQPFAI
jgi:hypothetical protein